MKHSLHPFSVSLDSTAVHPLIDGKERTDLVRGEPTSLARLFVPQPRLSSTTTPGSMTPRQAWMIDGKRWNPASKAIKRKIDVLLAAALLLALGPILLLAMLLIKLTSGSGVIFRQPRIGLHGEVFEMFKLRSMVNGAEALEEEFAGALEGSTFFKIQDDPRVTPLGCWLRKFSVDEIPQLINVVRGEMSLVGPRPLLLIDFNRFPKDRQLRRLGVLPGLTGLWQVSGRSDTSDEERMNLDLDYIDGWSVWLDLKILVRTIGAVLSAKGAT